MGGIAMDWKGMILKLGLSMNIRLTHSVPFVLEKYQGEHFLQEVLPSKFDAEPTGHMVQERASCAENVPALHGVHFGESHPEEKYPN
jgi:hypothetical protein